MAVNRQLGVNSAIILKYGTADQATVKGINRLTLPALTRSKITSEEFGVDFNVHDAGGGEHGDLSYGGNMVAGDTKGQDQLKSYLINNTKFTDARVYIDTVLEHFLAPDTAADSETGFQVLSHVPGEVGKNGTYPFTGSFAINGKYAVFTVHKTDVATPTLAFVAAVTPGTTSATITDSASGFVDAGFAAGQSLIIEGSTSNDGMYTILSVIAGTITLVVADALSAEPSPGVACSLHGGTM